MKTKILALFFLAFFTLSCVDYSDLQFGGIEKLETKSSGLSNMNVVGSMRISNSSKSNIVVKSLDCEIFSNGKRLVSIELQQGVKIERRKSDQIIELPLRIRLEGSMLSLAAVAFRPQSLSANVKIRARAGLLTKKIELKDLKIGEVAKLIGVEPSQLLKGLM